MKLEESIRNMIEEHFEQFDNDIVSELDIEDLCSSISDRINSAHKFVVDPAPYSDENGQTWHCQVCQKPFCDFVSNSGVRVSADDIMKNNSHIYLD